MADVHIPDDILMNIFTRLPAKPLLRSRCVSKHWNRLISDPYFMNARSCRKILLVSPPLYVLDGSVPVDDLAHSEGRLRYPFEIQSFENVRIVGTFNGIVLFVAPDDNLVVGMPGYHTNHMILYNPFTGASKILPDLYSPSNDIFHLYGFCYGATQDDLKIVRFRDYTSGPNHNWNTCDVFTLKTSSWSTFKIAIQNGDFVRPWADFGIFINGFLYWVASKKIVALSVKEMIISEISHPFPNYVDMISGKLHGCLSMITSKNSFFDREFSVWVMKEHEVENPWLKVYSFELPIELSCKHGFRIINALDDGRILMVDFSYHLIIYDTFQHSYYMLDISPGFIDNPDARAIEYDESLISP